MEPIQDLEERIKRLAHNLNYAMKSEDTLTHQLEHDDLTDEERKRITKVLIEIQGEIGGINLAAYSLNIDEELEKHLFRKPY